MLVLKSSRWRSMPGGPFDVSRKGYVHRFTPVGLSIKRTYTADDHAKASSQSCPTEAYKHGD